VSLVSIPRDLIIKIPESENITKINSLYSLGKTFSPLEPIKFIKEKIYDSYDRTEGFEEELSDFEEFVNSVLKDTKKD